MPTIRVIVSATTTDALANNQFNIIPPGTGGAYLSLYGAAVTKTDSYGLSIGSKIIVPNGTNMNIEASADVIDNDRDGQLFNEWVPEGQLKMPVTVTTEAQILIYLKYVNPLP